MKLRRRIVHAVTAAGLAAGALVASAPASHAAESRVVCRTSVLNVRDAPGTWGSVVGQVYSGQSLSVTPVWNSSWYQIGYRRYVSGSYLCLPASSSTYSASAATAVLMKQPTSTTGTRVGPYGWRTHPVTGEWSLHTGIDIGSRAWMPVYAAASGRVAVNSYGTINGRWIRVEHGTVGTYSNVASYYLHLNQSKVYAGQWVSKGQLIGYTGDTGRATGPHLHFGVRVGSSMVDPQKFLGPNSSLVNF